MPRWEGSTAVIIASGPSLTVEDCELVKAWQGVGRHAIAINTSYQRAHWADVLYACDGHWWDHHIKQVEKTFLGELWTQDHRAARQHGLHYILSERKDGLSRVDGVIHQGSNSGYQSINLAYHWGVKRMLLLGYDMSDHGSQTHWHQPHAKFMVSPFDRWLVYFEKLARDLKDDGIEVINCTRRTAMKCFPMGDLEYELARTLPHS